jgi:hypothetical protein
MLHGDKSIQRVLVGGVKADEGVVIVAIVGRG